MDNSTKPTKVHPRLRANPLSVLFFSWLLPTLWKAYKQGYGPEDQSMALPWDKAEKISDRLEKNWINEELRAKRCNQTPKFSRALIKTYWLSVFLNGVLQLMQAILRAFIPMYLIYLVRHFDPDSTSSTQYACFMAAGISVSSMVAMFLKHHAEFQQGCIGMRMRIGCTSLMYKKVHRLSRAGSSTIAAGQLVNLLSNDVARYDVTFLYANYIWIIPIQIILVTFLTYTQVGSTAFIGIAALLLQSLPFQYILAKATKKLRSKIAGATDERIKLMNELISGIQVIKMYAWEVPFAKVVSAVREREIRFVRHALYVRSIYQSLQIYADKITLYSTLVACYLLGQSINTGVVFALMVFYNMLQQSTNTYFPLALASLFESLVSTKRIQDFLLLPEIIDGSTSVKEEKNDTSKKLINRNGVQKNGFKREVSSTLIELKNVNANWVEDTVTLQNISLTVKSGQLCALVGAVGSGKSSLLQLLIGELPITNGNIVVSGDISYSSQEPWLFNGTIRSNILFGLSYEENRYKEVVRTCALERDFQLFPSGDQTIVGERGASLSGGQRARINLARSVYRQADIYIMDDPLSAVDAPVGKHLISECFGKVGFLSKKTRIIATHQLNILKEADWIVVLANGHIETQGTYLDLENTLLKSLGLLDIDKDEIHSDEEHDREFRKISIISERKLPILSKLDTDQKSTAPKLGLEGQESGSTKAVVYWKYFRAGTQPFGLLMMMLLIIITQVFTSGYDYWVIFWTRQETLRSFQNADKSSPAPLLESVECIYIYSVILICFLILVPSKNILLYKLCCKSSGSLHGDMFRSILSTPMKFFDLNPLGRILNRFTKDMNVTDEALPRSLSITCQYGAIILGCLILMIIINQTLVIPIIIVVIFYVIFLRLFMISAVDLRRTEGIARSPIYSYVTSSLTGIATIRCCNISKKLIKEFDILQDVHTSSWHLSIASQALLGFSLDFISVLLLTSVTYSFILMKYFGYTVISGNVGYTTASSLMLTGLAQFIARQITDIINNMTSVERVLEYTDLEQEPKIDAEPPQNWPSTGKLEFKSVNFSYSSGEPPTLKDLSFVIETGWKIGVVGRTGAGKSSLISAIFRLYPVDGQIIIDSLDTGNISLQSLRSKISIIPQNPVLFSTTLRHNLDPFEQFDDFMLWKVLEDVELKNAVESLDFKVTAGGNNFSVGQRQLICLARAILRDNKILLLDEATANVDQKTDALIQHTIRSKFNDFTVVTIAHRLNTVMDSDRILVLDAGHIMEYGIPYKLLQNPNGVLTKMTKGSFQSLFKIAEETFQMMLGTVPNSDALENFSNSEIEQFVAAADTCNTTAVENTSNGVVNTGYVNDEITKL